MDKSQIGTTMQLLIKHFTKICTSCNTLKSLSFYHKNKMGRMGRQSQCKQCFKNGIKNPQHIYINNQKKCNKCKEYKDFNEYGYSKSSKVNTQTSCKKCQKIYRDSSKHKISESNKRYRESNKEEISIKKKKYWEENKKMLAKKSKQFRKENKDKIAKRKKEDYFKDRKNILKKMKAYQQTPKGKLVAKNANHKRRQIEKQGNVDTDYLIEIVKNSKTCYWCGNKLNKNKIHIDHYQPLSKGGSHTADNQVVSCAKCNLTKNSKDPFEFAHSKGKLL